jgi:hypothetical protein
LAQIDLAKVLEQKDVGPVVRVELSHGLGIERLGLGPSHVRENEAVRRHDRRIA